MGNGNGWLGDHSMAVGVVFLPSSCTRSGCGNAILDLKVPVISSVGGLWGHLQKGGMTLGNVLGRLADPF